MEKLQEILKYTKDLVNQEPEKSAFWHYNKLVSKIEEAIERQEQLSLCSVSGMFSEKHLIQAYNDGMEAEQQRCDNFDIENYR